MASAGINHVRKAERAGLVVECDSSGGRIPVFYDLFRTSINRWAEQQHEPRLLARWRNQRRDSAAAILVPQGGANASYTRGAMRLIRFRDA